MAINFSLPLDSMDIFTKADDSIPEKIADILLTHSTPGDYHITPYRNAPWTQLTISKTWADDANRLGIVAVIKLLYQQKDILGGYYKSVCRNLDYKIKGRIKAGRESLVMEINDLLIELENDIRRDQSQEVPVIEPKLVPDTYGEW